jgi:hypothetical protein
MPTFKTITLYSFDELTDKGKDNAVERLYDLNVDYSWWDSTCEDAARVGIEITEFDTCHLTIGGKLTLSLPESAAAVLREHGEACGTHATATSYLEAYMKAFRLWLPEQDEDSSGNHTEQEWLRDFSCEEEANELAEDYRRAILEDYLFLLRDEYECLTSRDAIVESIQANDYLFTEHGKLS